MAAAAEASATHLPMEILGDAPQVSKAAALMQEIRTFGRLPKRVNGTSEAQTNYLFFNLFIYSYIYLFIFLYIYLSI